MPQTTSDGATRIRVGLADDEPLLTAGLAMILSAQDDLEVLWRAERGDEALVRATEQPVDVLLLDVQMPGPDGLETTRRWVGDGRPGRVVIPTTFDTDGYVMGASEAGAAGFLLKNTAPEEIVRAIRTVDRGDLLVEGASVDHGAAEVGQVSHIAVGQFGCLAEEVVAHAIPHRPRNIRARCGRALLPLILEGAANERGAQHIRVR